MRALLQRVLHASVSVDAQLVGQIGRGLCILLGAGPNDTPEGARALATKCSELRIFNDDAGKMNLSLLDVAGQALVVSQFTLYADTRRGRRPSFTGAAPPDVAAPLVDTFAAALRERGIHTETGIFGADMLVEIANDGPVTIWLDTDSS
ncbi:MAG TPA: D-aminoacyl-tRNA deacylase [Chloroflexota bacterium]|nr:D-aminoacyl-tRNA deacylase [Chloroflexota bacterium]